MQLRNINQANRIGENKMKLTESKLKEMVRSVLEEDIYGSYYNDPDSGPDGNTAEFQELGDAPAPEVYSSPSTMDLLNTMIEYGALYGETMEGMEESLVADGFLQQGDDEGHYNFESAWSIYVRDGYNDFL